jgi:DNA helicase II / ATP-dependent DNA helicase PcrA
VFWDAARHVQDHIQAGYQTELNLPSIGDSAAVENFLQTALHLKGTLQLVLDDEYPSAITPDYAEKLGRDFTFLKIYNAFEAQRWPARNPDHPAFRGAHDATFDLARWLLSDETLDLCPRWPRGLALVLVDEMHDLNAAMFSILIKVLKTNAQAYFVGAGDRHQVIHQLNGADVTYMQDALPAHLGKVVRALPLTLSQRFGPELAKWAGEHAHKKYAGSPQQKTKVHIKNYDDTNPCETQMAQLAIDWRRDTKKLYRPEFVILLRHAHQSLAIENTFLKAEIPYSTLGFESYLLRPEVLWVRGLLALLLDNVTSIASALSRERMLRAFVLFSGIELKDKDRPERTPLQVLDTACKDARENPQVLRWFFDHQVLPNSPDFVKKRLHAAMKSLR